MLNELKILADSISEIGISVENWDDKFKEIKKTSPCFVVYLSAEGTISFIRKLGADNAKVLRTWQGGSLGSTFPAFNFQPFYAFVSGKGKAKDFSPKEKESAAAQLVELLSKSESLPDVEAPLKVADRKKADEKTVSCLGKVSAAFFKLVCSDEKEGDLLIRFRDAFNRFFPLGSTASTFNEKILAYLRNYSNIVADDIRDILVSNGDVVLFFDVLDTGFGAIASEMTTKRINERLMARKECKSATRETDIRPCVSEVDAFGQELSAEVKKEKLPEVKLPGVLANTKLRSMNAESECQRRYGLIDAESFPVGSEIRKAAKAALEWISCPEREGKTWAIAGASELVFAYPKSMPKTPPLLARLFGNGRSISNDESIAEARFEEYAKAALDGIKSLSQSPSPNTEIEVFAIKKADKARRKVVFYRNYSLETLRTSVDQWLAGALNIPSVRFREWPRRAKGENAQKGTKPVVAEFQAPLPLATVGIAYRVWSQDGNEKVEPKFRSAPLYEGLPMFDGLELFLGDAINTGLAQRMLSTLLQNSVGLCVSAGNISHRTKDNVIANSSAAVHLETALPLFGILLHKLNHNKETYMENTPYLIGRFLNLADGLHSVWCRNVKEKDPLPPQLLGSSLFASFQINPVQAFAIASLRLKPYLDWAKTNQTKDAALSRWFVGEFGRVCSAIVKSQVPVRLSDTDKAEMLLGYLASSGKSLTYGTESSDATTSSSDNN